MQFLCSESPRKTARHYLVAMGLEPCSARDFDIEVIRYASLPGWRPRIAEGERRRGLRHGWLVLRMQRRDIYAAHFRAAGGGYLRAFGGVSVAAAGIRSALWSDLSYD